MAVFRNRPLNKKSRIPVLQPLISFVMSWTQSVIEHNVETKQLHPTHQTQGSIARRYFWEGGQARFPAMSSSPHSTYSWWGSYQVLTAASQWVRCRPAAITILEPHWNHERRSGLAGNGLYYQNKAFVQREALHSTKCADTEYCPGDGLYDGAFQPLRGRSSPNREQTRDLCMCK